jgi:hypothetical protein
MRALTPEEYARLSRESACRLPCHPGCVDIPKEGEEGDDDYNAADPLVELGYYAWRDCPFDDTRLHGERTLLGDEAIRIYRITRGMP